MTTGNPPSEQDAPLPYQAITDAAYAVYAANSFSVTELGHGTLVLRGPCPRCHGLIDIPVVSGIFRSARSIGSRLRARAPKTAEAGHKEPMMCTCECDHPNRPEGRTGCGAYWTLTISPPAP